MRPVEGKSQDQIAQEWDRIALRRAHQIESGADLSYRNILLPSIMSLISASDLTAVLDAGCGAGFLTAELAKRATESTGIDISQKSIEYAIARWGSAANIRFATTSIEEYGQRQEPRRFTVAVSNMTLMTVLDLDNVVKSLSRLVVPGGHLAATITHPCFWPHYWGYAGEEWFSYAKEIVIESDFRISFDRCDGFITTHIHRPLERYLAALSRGGFLLEEFREPLPTPEVERRYPTPWQYPRFVALRATRR